MAEEKFTKGPWSVSQTYIEESSVLDSHGFNIANVEMSATLDDWRRKHPKVAHRSNKEGVTYRELSEEEVRANAHLIAAAPQLYEALKAFMDAVAVPKSDREAEMNAIKHAYERGRAALSAALGGK